MYTATAIRMSDSPVTIQVAAGDGELDTVQRLLEAGVSVNDADTFGYTALHAAAGYCQTEMMKFLISVGADVHAGDCDGDTPLHSVESVDCAAILLEAGAVLDAANKKGRTPLYNALKDEREEVAAFLQARGAEPIEVPPEGLPDSDSDGDMDIAIKRMIEMARASGEEVDDASSFPDVDEGDDEKDEETSA